MVAAPTVLVEIKWSSGPDWASMEFPFILGVSGFSTVDWTDVSADLLGVSLNRGRDRELSEYRSGTASVQLLNNSRQYEPDFAAGPYYGNIKPGRMIRISLNSVIVFKGAIRQFNYAYQTSGINSGNSVVTINASDIISDISNMEFALTTTGGVLSGAQVVEILNEVGISDRVIDPGSHTMQSTNYPAGSNALTTIQNIAYSEAVDVAAVYASKTGAVIYGDYLSLADKVSIGTFGPSALPIHTIQLTYESDLIKNSVSYERTGGSPQVQTSAASISDYGLKSLTRTGLTNATDGDVSNLALDAINQFALAEFRIRQFVLKPRANSALMAAAISMEIRDKLVVQFSPPMESGSGTITQTHFIVGLKMEITPQDFTVTVVCNSDTGKLGNWILGSAVLGTSKLGW